MTQSTFLPGEIVGIKLVTGEQLIAKASSAIDLSTTKEISVEQPFALQFEPRVDPETRQMRPALGMVQWVLAKNPERLTCSFLREQVITAYEMPDDIVTYYRNATSSIVIPK